MSPARAALIVTAAGSLVAAAMVTAPAAAFPPYYAAWQERYPNSTLPQHMEATAGSVCFVCHHPPIGVGGNCYREDLKALLAQSIPIEEALDILDGMDSDGDGVPNGVEIMTPRADSPGMIGYSPGLVGALGTDPCAADPTVPVTNSLETPDIGGPECPADWNGDESVNSNDISAFLTDWLADVQGGTTVADFNGDGVTNSNDISAFLTAWLDAVQNGC